MTLPVKTKTVPNKKINKNFKDTFAAHPKTNKKSHTARKSNQQDKNKKDLQNFKKSKTSSNSKSSSPIVRKGPSTALNIDFFSVSDGVYSSYWVGKFANMLLREGGKKVVLKSIYRSFALIKYLANENPLTAFLEILERIKPTFRLRNYIIRRVIIKEYPIVTLRPRQYLIALNWVKSEIRANNHYKLALSEEIAHKLLDFKANPKKNSLTRKRMEYTKRTIMAQFNARYTWKKR